MATVETFSVVLPADILQAASSAPEGVDTLESTIEARLPDCDRLLRWAIIRPEKTGFLCEGAYLTRR